jgi:predicted Zn finger-like uncharacterized protein
MYTVCPKCALTLVVTAADLRVAQGFVRCGRCSNVFNALARLSEERSGTVAGVASPTLSQPAPPPPPKEPEPPVPTPSAHEQNPPRDLAETDSIPDSALEFNPAATDVSKVFVEQAPDPQWSAATGKFQALFRKSQPRTPASAPSQQGTPQATRPPAGLTKQPSAAAHTPPPPQSTASAQPAPAPPLTTPTFAAPAPQPSSPASAPLSPATPSAATPQTIPTDEDAQFDIEVDAEFLAATTQLRAQPFAPPAAPTGLGATSAGTPKSPASLSAAPPGSAPPGSALPAPPTPGSAPPASALPSVASPVSAPEASQAPAAPASAAGSSGALALQRAPARQPRPAPERTVQDVGFASQGIGGGTESPADDLGETSGAEGPRPALNYLWSAGTAVLVILLAGQIVNHYRHDLATHERLYEPLTRLYAALGIPLVPRWDLGAYDVRQLGASAGNSSAGQITVRASVKNTAKQPQPLPLLRVTLQDRFGNRIAARDVPPKSYLPPAIAPSSFLSAGQRVDAEMAFVDPGSNAVGFEIDACLPEPGGSIACANDTSTR